MSRRRVCVWRVCCETRAYRETCQHKQSAWTRTTSLQPEGAGWCWWRRRITTLLHSGGKMETDGWTSVQRMKPAHPGFNHTHTHTHTQRHDQKCNQWNGRRRKTETEDEPEPQGTNQEHRMTTDTQTEAEGTRRCRCANEHHRWAGSTTWRDTRLQNKTGNNHETNKVTERRKRSNKGTNWRPDLCVFRTKCFLSSRLTFQQIQSLTTETDWGNRSISHQWCSAIFQQAVNKSVVIS